MNKILISNKISRELRKSISEHGFHVVDLPDYSRFDSPVASHADMLVYKIDDHCILTYKEYYLHFKCPGACSEVLSLFFLQVIIEHLSLTKIAVA